MRHRRYATVCLHKHEQECDERMTEVSGTSFTQFGCDSPVPPAMFAQFAIDLPGHDD